MKQLTHASNAGERRSKLVRHIGDSFLRSLLLDAFTDDREEHRWTEKRRIDRERERERERVEPVRRRD